MDHSRAPLYEELFSFIQNLKGNYHVPGHKQGNAFDRDGLKYFQKLLELDLTEVGSLDDLHNATGVIRDAEELAADAFQADHTFFLVGGTTSGNIASVLSTVSPGETILIQRTCHQSVFHGCLLAGANPIYIPVEVDEKGLEKPLSIQNVEKLLWTWSSTKGVVITSPTYYGVTQSVSELATLCHKYNVPLIVDEAHGAHFGFHPLLPPSSMQLGADISIQSTHKMLTSMTMSSMLHIKGNRIDLRKVSRWLKAIQSSSPSYPLMASLDLSRRFMMTEGKNRLDILLHKLNIFREKIRTLEHLQEVELAQHDPLKLTLASRRYRISGFMLLRWLENEGYYAELHDQDKILFVFSLGTSIEDLEKLFRYLQKLDKAIPQLPRREQKALHIPSMYDQPKISLNTLRERIETEVPLGEAVGKIITEMITPYPPGIPLFLPGEELTQEKFFVLQKVIQNGLSVRGITYKSSSPYLCVLQ